MKIKRYDHYPHGMEQEQRFGNWVKYEDYQELQLKYQRMKRERNALESLRNKIDTLLVTHDDEWGTF